MREGMEFDPIWQEAYATGFSQRWPWDSVVSFVFRHAPRERPRSEVDIFELGCGSGSNLWFAAKEGFRVAGIDGSRTAIAEARQRFDAEGLSGDLRIGDFTAALPPTDKSIDLVIDRGSLSCVGISVARRVIGEVGRILRPGGAFLFSPYGGRHPAVASGRKGDDGLVLDITESGLAGLGAISFWEEEDIRASFDHGWQLVSLARLTLVDSIDPNASRDEWYVVARRIGSAIL